MGVRPPPTKTRNRDLTTARTAKQDEFYTQYADVQKEVEAYVEHDQDVFRGKVVYCNCNDHPSSSFFRYFAANFNGFGLKRLVGTGYDWDGDGRGRSEAFATILDHVEDEGGGVTADVDSFLERNDAARVVLKGYQHYRGGDFRSPDCVALLKEADVVVTNPPFSLFRGFVAQLIAHEKRFLLLANLNAITYKMFFPRLQANEIWLGPTIAGGDREFQIPDDYPLVGAGSRVDENGTKFLRVKGVRWFTNLDHGRRPKPMNLMTMEENRRFNKKLAGKFAYSRYANYDAIEVPFTDAIPSDHDGTMGVPISFMDKYSPEQFEILGMNGIAATDARYRNRLYSIQDQKDAHLRRFGRPGTVHLNGSCVVDDVAMYRRILIRHRRR